MALSISTRITRRLIFVGFIACFYSFLHGTSSTSDLRRSLEQLRRTGYHQPSVYRGHRRIPGRSPSFPSIYHHRNQESEVFNPFKEADRNFLEDSDADYDMFDLLSKRSKVKKRDWMDINVNSQDDENNIHRPVKRLEESDREEISVEEVLLREAVLEAERNRLPLKRNEEHSHSGGGTVLQRKPNLGRGINQGPKHVTAKVNKNRVGKYPWDDNDGAESYDLSKEDQNWISLLNYAQNSKSKDQQKIQPKTHSEWNVVESSLWKTGWQLRNSTYRVDLDTSGNYRLHWTVDNPAEVIYFRLEANVDKKDMLAFGFSSYGQAEDADFIVLWTGLDGRHLFQDAHTDGRGLLKIDKQQDYILDDVTVTKDGYLAVEFHRQLDTCDRDDYLIDSGTTHLLVLSLSGEMRTIHDVNMTSQQPIMQRSQLIKSQLPDPQYPPDTRTLTVHVDNVHVPEEETTYWCALRKLPDFKEKHHIIQFEGAISKAGEGIVHHLEVFHCRVPADVELPSYDAPCVKTGRPKGLESCMKVLGAWAMGAKPVSYPEEAGSPIGGSGLSRYIMLEVHYNNPEHKKGVIDSSGLKFHITRSLRRYDAGVMELGLEYTDKMALPPGQEAVKLVGYCVPECTEAAFPPEGIRVFASQLHTHLTGRAAYTKHYRDGVELPELNRDNHFSPHYQEIRKLHRQIHVLPGDSLVTTCVDRTIDRPNVTLGGFAITDEMCVNYIHYYPLVDLEVCKSSVTTSALYGFFNFMNEYQDEKTSNASGISDNYQNIRWTPMNAALLEAFYQEAPLSMQCNRSDGTRYPGRAWENIQVPKILQPMPQEVRPCLQ